jgi:hypothetical protein
MSDSKKISDKKAVDKEAVDKEAVDKEAVDKEYIDKVTGEAEQIIKSFIFSVNELLKKPNKSMLMDFELLFSDAIKQNDDLLLNIIKKYIKNDN